jgi:hypothetical protein
MAEQRNGMRALRCEKQLERRRVSGQRHFLDADTGFDAMRERHTSDKKSD